MVRINIIEPRRLTDQHLVAEYDEILMLIGHTRKYPKSHSKPEKYCLGPGHICFFKDKLIYLKKRHEELKKEMVKRGFKPKVSVDLRGFGKESLNGWKPSAEDIKIIKKRITQRLKEKPGFYRYYGEKKSQAFLVGLLNKK